MSPCAPANSLGPTLPRKRFFSRIGSMGDLSHNTTDDNRVNDEVNKIRVELRAAALLQLTYDRLNR